MIGLIGPFDGPNARELKGWIKEHMPDLDRELGPMSPSQVRRRLNAETGCNVSGSDSIERGCVVFLDALQSRNLPPKTNHII